MNEHNICTKIKQKLKQNKRNTKPHCERKKDCSTDSVKIKIIKINQYTTHRQSNWYIQIFLFYYKYFFLQTYADNTRFAHELESKGIKTLHLSARACVCMPMFVFMKIYSPSVFFVRSNSLYGFSVLLFCS